MASPAYQRVLLKVSGEALLGDQPFGIDPEVTAQIAEEIADIHGLGVQIAVVIGGGNISADSPPARAGWTARPPTTWGCWRRSSMRWRCRTHWSRLTSSVESSPPSRCAPSPKPFIRRRAVRHLEKGRVVVFAAGTGNPYFTTDTAAALRAMEIRADVILKGTKVDGIYSADPLEDPAATRFDSISYLQVLEQGLKVMDATAISLCMDNGLPIVVFNLQARGTLRRAVMGEPVGSLVKV